MGAMPSRMGKKKGHGRWRTRHFPNVGMIDHWLNEPVCFYDLIKFNAIIEKLWQFNLSIYIYTVRVRYKKSISKLELSFKTSGSS